LLCNEIISFQRSYRLKFALYLQPTEEVVLAIHLFHNRPKIGEFSLKCLYASHYHTDQQSANDWGITEMAALLDKSPILPVSCWNWSNTCEGNFSLIGELGHGNTFFPGTTKNMGAAFVEMARKQTIVTKVQLACW